ncbi:hypothetical protein FEM03_06425 [Phragmitibacter flavus]|uniref:DUF3153 domain-containing protein n=1 Tax=Phragmitibacter flavus TaxID=2576071 RepID=A0A5R8KJH0_9BACT|nr:hypothetical protein [Phragmitibacter flavus]TLD71769.1 hypothetical protein FEM03_06425 [Phragmitibacter flavus]
MSFSLKSCLGSLAAVLLLSGCLDYEEEMTIKENLSGEARITLTLPDSLVGKFSEVQGQVTAAKIKEHLDKVSGVRLLSHELRQGRQPVVKMVLSFDSLEAWNEAVALHPQAVVLAGKFTKEKTEKGMVIERQLGGGMALPNGLPDFNFVNYTTKYASPIVATNSRQLNAHGNEVRYRYQLSELMQQQPMMSTTVEHHLPWLMLVAGSVAALAVLWKVWGMVKPKSKRKG